jgi:hypothetical protein
VYLVELLTITVLIFLFITMKFHFFFSYKLIQFVCAFLKIVQFNYIVLWSSHKKFLLRNDVNIICLTMILVWKICFAWELCALWMVTIWNWCIHVRMWNSLCKNQCLSFCSNLNRIISPHLLPPFSLSLWQRNRAGKKVWTLILIDFCC